MLLLLQWSSSEIGIKFDKANGIYSQLTKIRNGGGHRLTAKERKERRKDSLQSESGSTPLEDAALGLSAAPALAMKAAASGPGEQLDVESQFASLKSFYNGQIADTATGSSAMPGLGDLGFASPNSLTAIMSIYTGGNLGDKKGRSESRDDAGGPRLG